MTEQAPSQAILPQQTTESPGLNLIGQEREQIVALLDLDGTLTEKFTISRFVRHLHDERIGDEKARKRLLEMFDQMDEGRYPDGYFKFIDQSAALYGQMLTGLQAEKIQRIGYEWGMDQSRSHHLLPHSLKTVELLKEMGIIPTLVTGTPIEAIQGYRTALGIEDRCYALEPWIQDGRYTGTIRYNTGLPKEKAGVVRQMAMQKHKIIFAMGDQGSDGPLIKGALTVQPESLHSDVFGSAVVINAPGKIQTEFETYHADAISKGRLQIVDPKKVDKHEIAAIIRTLIERAVQDPVTGLRLESIRNKVLDMAPHN